ncbi:MAG: PHP domain-containing protein [Chlamydiales bacterium]|nr:PHP domain-containing protein [Chlamydiales bacterium]
MTNQFRADIHCHSYCSDGSDSPSSLIDLAVSSGLQGLSITDHDTVAAYTPELFEEAKEKRIQLLTGVELSTEFQNISIHILGYGIDIHASSLHTFIEEIQRRRKARNQEILAKLAKRNLIISEEELYALSAHPKTIGRPHIAALMVQKGYTRTWQEAFDVYLKDGACCYAAGVKYTSRQAIEAIHLAKGKAVLAHPHFLPRGFVQRHLFALPFDGIECYYGRLPKRQELPWVQLTEKKGWIVTGGSDYHGSFKPNLSLGCSWVGESTFAKLLAPSMS